MRAWALYAVQDLTNFFEWVQRHVVGFGVSQWSHWLQTLRHWVDWFTAPVLNYIPNGWHMPSMHTQVTLLVQIKGEGKIFQY